MNLSWQEDAYKEHFLRPRPARHTATPNRLSACFILVTANDAADHEAHTFLDGHMFSQGGALALVHDRRARRSDHNGFDLTRVHRTCSIEVSPTRARDFPKLVSFRDASNTAPIGRLGDKTSLSCHFRCRAPGTADTAYWFEDGGLSR